MTRDEIKLAGQVALMKATLATRYLAEKAKLMARENPEKKIADSLMLLANSVEVLFGFKRAVTKDVDPSKPDEPTKSA